MACEDGGEHEGSGKFCSKCGQGIAKKCVFCDAVLEKPYKFCGECAGKQGQAQGAHALQAPAAQLPVVMPVTQPCAILMPKADVYIPDPSLEESISQQDKDYYEKFVIDMLEPSLAKYQLTFLTSRHEQFPVTGIRFQLIEQAARNCEKVLFALMPALAGRTMMEMFKAHSDKMVFLRESDEDGGNSFKHIVEQHFVISCRSSEELNKMCHKLHIQIHGQTAAIPPRSPLKHSDPKDPEAKVPLPRPPSTSSTHQANSHSEKENPSVRPKVPKESHSYEQPPTTLRRPRAQPASPPDERVHGNPPVRTEMSERGRAEPPGRRRAEPPGKMHVDNRVSGSLSFTSSSMGERRLSSYTQRQENNTGPLDDQMNGNEEQEGEDEEEEEDVDKERENVLNDDVAVEERPPTEEVRNKRSGSDASSCTGSVKSEIAPRKNTISDDTEHDTDTDTEEECYNITSRDTRYNTSPSGLATTSSRERTSKEISRGLQRLCHCADEDEVQNIIEVIAKADWRKEGLDQILSHHPSQKLACHVIPQAARTRRLCVLAKLFVFSGSCPALQLEAGHVHRDTIFRTLSHSHEILSEITELEKVLRDGFNFNIKDSVLVGLFAEIYKFTVFSIVLGNRHRPTGDHQQFQQFSGLEVALKDFLDKCCRFHPTKSHFLKFQLEMVLDVLKPDILLNHNDILETLWVLVESAKTNQTPQDRRQVEDAVAKSLDPRKLKDSERCLLLHYFASAIQNNCTLLPLCKQVFRQELARAKRKKDEKLLFSCAVLFEQMCHFVSRKETIDEIMVDKTRPDQNPFLSLLDACPKSSLHCLKQLLAPLLYHPSPFIRSKVTDALLPAETNGDLSPESKARYVEYQRQHLEKKLLRFGVLLLQDCDVRCDEDEGVVTYRGELHTGKEGMRRILCKAPAASTVADLKELGDGPDHALLRMMEVLHALNDHQASHRADDDRHFIQVLIQMRRPMVVVVDQDWKLPTLSDVLLIDLRSNDPRISLRNMIGIIKSIFEAAIFAHSKEILLRAFSAESFLMKKSVGGTMKVIFWDVKAARRGTFDSFHQLHYVGNKQDSSLAVLWLAPESILQSDFDERSEVYSLAKGCYEILCHGIYPHTGHSGLDTASVIRQNLQYMNLPGRRLGVPMSVYLLILQCLLVNREKRPTLEAFYEAINSYMTTTDLDAEDKTHLASTKDSLKTLAGIQVAHTLDKRLPKEFEQDRKSSDIGDRGSKLDDLYCAAMQEHVPTSISQCEDHEIREHDDPRVMDKSIGLFEACIMKKSMDEKEKSKIISLVHKNLPKKMTFLRKTGCEHIALRMFVSSECQDLLSYFLEKQPRLDARIAFYLQICDVIKYLHEKDLILCYLNPEHIMVIDGGKQLVIVHLSRLTRVVKTRGESARDVIVSPFLDKWPRNAARWSPLECNESGYFSMQSDVAMIALCIHQLESAIGKGKDVPIRDTVPYSYIPADNLVEAQRCHYNPPQSPQTPDWLYKLVLAMIVNQDFRRPPLEDEVSDVNQAFRRPPQDYFQRVTSSNVVTTHVNTTGVITFLKEKRFSGREKQVLSPTNLKKRTSKLLDEEEAELLVGGIPIAKRGSKEYQVEVRRKTARLSAPEPATKQDKTFFRHILRRDKSMETDDELGIGARLKKKVTPPVAAAATKHNQRITNRHQPFTPTQKQKAERQTIISGQKMYPLVRQSEDYQHMNDDANPVPILRLREDKNTGNIRDSHIYEEV